MYEIKLLEWFESEMIMGDIIYVYNIVRIFDKKRGVIDSNRVLYCYVHLNTNEVYIYNKLGRMYNNINEDIYNKNGDILYSDFRDEEKKRNILIKKS